MDEKQIGWGDVPERYKGEKVTEKQMKDAESMGRLPVGKYLCTCIDSRPKQKNPKSEDGSPAPSYFVANLKWRVDSVVEIDRKPVSGDEGEQYEGRFIFDEIALQKDGEKDGMRNRRIMVAKRTGIMAATGREIPTDAWSKLIIGKRALISHVEETYKDKTGVDQIRRKVAFDGYESADKAVKAGGDTFSDI